MCADPFDHNPFMLEVDPGDQAVMIAFNIKYQSVVCY
jgi:hypothetical protein